MSTQQAAWGSSWATLKYLVVMANLAREMAARLRSADAEIRTLEE